MTTFERNYAVNYHSARALWNSARPEPPICWDGRRGLLYTGDSPFISNVELQALSPPQRNPKLENCRFKSSTSVLNVPIKFWQLDWGHPSRPCSTRHNDVFHSDHANSSTNRRGTLIAFSHVTWIHNTQFSSSGAQCSRATLWKQHPLLSDHGALQAQSRAGPSQETWVLGRGGHIGTLQISKTTRQERRTVTARCPARPLLRQRWKPDPREGP